MEGERGSENDVKRKYERQRENENVLLENEL